MNYFILLKSKPKIIVIDLNSIDISEYRPSHFVKLLVQLKI